MAEVSAALESKKMDKMKSVLAEFPKWEQQMSERQKSIMAAGDEERTTLLVAVSFFVLRTLKVAV